MIQYFYKVDFRYKIKKESDEYSSTFDLGVFSSHKNAHKKIDLCKNLEGFKNYSVENFEITKFGVHFPTKLNSKENIKLYFVEHEYSLIEEGDIIDVWSRFDCFSNEEDAMMKVEHLKAKSKIGKKNPDDFIISTQIVDDYNSWSNGFNKFDE